MTHWLDHSLVLASDYRVPNPDRVWPLLERRQDALADLGAHHVLVYASTTEPGRVLVMIAIHAREPVLELLRSRVFFDWFDAVGVEDIPAVFAGEVVERLDLSGEAGADGTRGDGVAGDPRRGRPDPASRTSARPSTNSARPGFASC